MPSTAGTEDLSITIAERIQTLFQALNEVDPKRVFFGRTYEIDPIEMPCADIELGPDVPVDQQQSKHQSALQTIYLDLYDQRNDSEALIKCAKYKALGFYAIMQDYTLGLPFVLDTTYGGAQEPASDADAGLPGWTMRVAFLVHYRFNDDDRTVFTG